jgi:hypothetical protein
MYGRRPWPYHATQIVKRLQGGPEAVASVGEFCDEFDKTNRLPTDITRTERAIGAILTGICAVFILGTALSCCDPYESQIEKWLPVELAAVLAALVASVIWTWATRWSLSLCSMKAMVVGPDGEPASRQQRCLRALLFWSVPLALTVILWGIHVQYAWTEEWILPAWGIGLAIIAVSYFGSVIGNREQGWHDRIVGTWLVPK